MAPLLETAFGLTFIFLVFSLITSWVVEYISMIMQRRGKLLHDFITDTLNDRFNKNWGLMLYGHPIIEALSREVRRPKGLFGFLYNNKLGIKRRLPAYLPSDEFAAALIELIANHGTDTYFVKDHVTGKQILREEKKISKSTYDDFLTGLSNLKESEVKTTLLSLSRSCNSAPDPFFSLKGEVARWFDSGMERLNGWYKRDTRKFLFLVGLGVAILFNVNSLVVIKRMYSDPQLRSAVSQAANQFLLTNDSLSHIPTDSNIDSVKRKIVLLKKELDPLNLPIGWESSFAILDIETFWSLISDNWIGWLLTAFALSFGAPFWFDTLKRLANVRSAGLSSASTKIIEPTIKK